MTCYGSTHICGNIHQSTLNSIIIILPHLHQDIYCKAQFQLAIQASAELRLAIISLHPGLAQLSPSLFNIFNNMISGKLELILLRFLRKHSFNGQQLVQWYTTFQIKLLRLCYLACPSLAMEGNQVQGHIDVGYDWNQIIQHELSNPDFDLGILIPVCKNQKLWPKLELD